MTAIAALMIALVLNTQPVQAGAPNGLLANILDKMTVAGSQLQTLRASISQQKRNTQIGINGPLEVGTIYYKPLKDGKYQLRIDYTRPETKTLIVNGDKFMLYQPDLNQALDSSIQNYAKKHSAGGLSFRFDQSMRAKYNISYVRDEQIDGVKTSVLSFIPKAGVNAPFKKLEQWVDHRSWLPIKIEITEKNNDVTWIRLGNLQQNVPLSNGFFSVKVKPGTKIIKG